MTGRLAMRLLVTAISTAAAPAHAELTAEELAKLAQNPIANLISVPFQNNTNFNYGPEAGTQNVLNVQPVIPFSINADWDLVTRTIVPLIWQPELVPNQAMEFGLGDIQLSGFLGPSQPGPGGLLWGAGAIVQIPTNSDERLGNKNWGLGPTAVVLKLEQGNPWVYGALVNNVWSLTSDERGGAYNNFLLQPFVNYNLPGGTYIASSPIVTANWRAESGQKWIVPLGLGVGHIFHLGKLPLNAQIAGYYNIVSPDDGPDWQLRAQIQFMFPK